MPGHYDNIEEAVVREKLQHLRIQGDLDTGFVEVAYGSHNHVRFRIGTTDARLAKLTWAVEPREGQVDDGVYTATLALPSGHAVRTLCELQRELSLLLRNARATDPLSDGGWWAPTEDAIRGNHLLRVRVTPETSVMVRGRGADAQKGEHEGDISALCKHARVAVDLELVAMVARPRVVASGEPEPPPDSWEWWPRLEVKRVVVHKNLGIYGKAGVKDTLDQVPEPPGKRFDPFGGGGKEDDRDDVAIPL